MADDAYLDSQTEDGRPCPERRISLREERLHELATSVNKMRMNEQQVDVTLVCGDQQFRAHKLILTASSEYFQEQFDAADQIEFENIEPQIMQTILDYIYLGITDSICTQEEFIVVLKAVSQVKVTSLFRYCCDQLAETVTSGNYRALLDIAEEFGDKTMERDVAKYVCENLTGILPTRQFFSLTTAQLINITETYRIVFFDECNDELVDAIMSWVKFDKDEREAHIGEIMELVDLNLLSADVVRGLVNDNIMFKHRVYIDLCQMVASNWEKYKSGEEGPARGARSARDAQGAQGKDREAPRKDVAKPVKGGAVAKGKARPAASAAAAYKVGGLEQMKMVLIGFLDNPDKGFIQYFNLKFRDWRPLQELPFLFTKFTCVAQLDASVYFIGSYKNVSPLETAVIYLDPMDQLQKLDCVLLRDILHPRSGAAAATLMGKLYLAGGLFSKFSSSAGIRCVSCYCPEINGWEEKPNLLFPRAGCNLLPVNEFLYAVGGNADPVNLIEQYNPDTESWTAVVLPTPVQAALFRKSIVPCQGDLYVLYDYIVGGEPVLVFNCTSNTWELQSADVPPHIMSANSLSTTEFQLPFVMLSSYGRYTPDYKWTPATREWERLAPAKGKKAGFKSSIVIYAHET